MVIINDRGVIIFVNAQSEKLFGYAAAELVGQAVEVLVPERYREEHAKHHATGYAAERSPHARALEASRGLFGRRKDGSEFPAQISLSPIRTDEGVFISSFIRDLSRLAASEARYQSLFDHVPLGLFLSTPEGRIIDANPAMVAMLGFTSKDALLSTRAETLYADPGDRSRYIEALKQTGLVRGFATTLRRPDGTLFPAELSTRAVIDATGGVVRIEGIVEDRSALRKTEAQLMQAQKMEAVGLLAGGIAHDFNNLLGAITVFGELAAADMLPEDPRREDLNNIQEAVQRATTLTRQLLAFSRQQVLRPEILNVNEIIENVLKILGRLIGEDIELITRLDRSAVMVRADASQLEQVLMNLAVNARDAMPAGGIITIATGREQIGEPEARTLGLVQAGEFAVLMVSDTGTGMAPEVRDRIFEPFFTTKGARGTGLGLATVYGIVRQSGGHVGVSSEPGQGASFTIRLPAVLGVTAEPLEESRETGALGGTETILVVEDDPAVRMAVTTVLTRLGYAVLVARAAPDALTRSAAHVGDIHLVISDVVMPGMDGPDLVRELRRSRADLKALLTSGYAGDAIRQHRVLELGVPFLEKPFTAVQLSRKVRRVLDGVDEAVPE